MLLRESDGVELDRFGELLFAQGAEFQVCHVRHDGTLYASLMWSLSTGSRVCMLFERLNERSFSLAIRRGSERAKRAVTKISEEQVRVPQSGHSGRRETRIRT